MAGSNTFGGTIKLEGEKQYRAAIQQINSELKVMASEMVKVTAEFEKMVRSTPRPVDEAGVLTNRKKYRAERSAPNEQCDNISDRNGDWKISLNKAEAELSRMESSLKDVNSQLEKSKTPLDKLNTELASQGEKLKLLQTEYKNVVLSQGEK